MALPWIVYSHHLSFVDGRPSIETTFIFQDDIDRIWDENEKYMKKRNLDKITPYWFYKFIFFAFLEDKLKNDFIEDQIFSNSSNMASYIAIWYLRDGNYNAKGKGIRAWHITNMCLSIWLQRNWIPEQITATYLVYKKRISIRDLEIKKQRKDNEPQQPH